MNCSAASLAQPAEERTVFLFLSFTFISWLVVETVKFREPDGISNKLPLLTLTMTVSCHRREEQAGCELYVAIATLMQK